MEAKNIFEGAKFGDKFVTENGKIAIYSYEDKYAVYTFINNCGVYSHHLTGEVLYTVKSLGDIVSRYQEPIDEIELDMAAHLYEDSCHNPSIQEHFIAGANYVLAHLNKRNNNNDIQ